MQQGIILAISAYFLWGLLPVYWKSIQEVQAFEILCHRIVWSFLFLMIVQIFKNKWEWVRIQLKNSKTLITYIGTSCFIGSNWLIYIWGVNSGYVVEVSLGHVALNKSVLLGFSGIVTSIPLLLFASAIKRMQLSMMGILQYILPTLLFILGVFLYREEFTYDRLIGFIIIWISLLIFSIEGILVRLNANHKINID